MQLVLSITRLHYWSSLYYMGFCMFNWPIPVYVEIFVTHLIIIIKSGISTFPILVIFVWLYHHIFSVTSYRSRERENRVLFPLLLCSLLCVWIIGYIMTWKYPFSQLSLMQYTPFAKSNGRFFSDTKINMMPLSNLYDFWWVHKIYASVHFLCKIYWLFAFIRSAPGF